MQPTPKITGQTKLFGLFADPVEQVQATVVMNSIFVKQGFDGVNIPLHVKAEDLPEVVSALKCIRNFHGFGATIPHKTAIAGLCDELLPNAKTSGVVNLIQVSPDGRWIGETFDGVGMVRAIQIKRSLGKKTRVLQVGAGGAGCSIAVALALEGVGYLAVVNRTQSRADELAGKIKAAAPECRVETGTDVDLSSFDVIVNTTSLGMNGKGPLPLDVSRVSENALIADVVGVPEPTPLLAAASARGLETVSGREMLDQIIQLGYNFLIQPSATDRQ